MAPKSSLYPIPLVIACLALTLAACEPISVSVNALGDMAFARAEGIFFQDGRTGRTIAVHWLAAEGGVPVLVRWAPDNATLAFTLKPERSSQSAALWVVKKDGTGLRKLYEADKVVTQLEWSPDGRRLSLAQQGEDSDLGVADLVLVELAGGEARVLQRNVADIHAWVDGKLVACIQVSSKHPKNSELLNGQLALVQADTGTATRLTALRIGANFGLDAHPGLRQLAFTALAVGEGAGDYLPASLPRAELEAYWEEDADDEQKALINEWYQPEDEVYRLRAGADEETLAQLYDILSGAGLLHLRGTGVWYCRAPDARSLDAASVVVKLDQLDTQNAEFLQFSPDGTRLLLQLKTEDGPSLGVLGLDKREFRGVAAPITSEVSANSSSVRAYPAWAGNDKLVFFREKLVYGSNGSALNLMSVDLASGRVRNLQPVIDFEVNRQVEERSPK